MRRWLFSFGMLLAFFVVSYVGVRYLVPFLLPFFLAMILAQVIATPVALLQRWLRLPRGAAVALVLLLAAGVVVLGMVWAISRLAAEIKNLAAVWPLYLDIGRGQVAMLIQRLGGLSVLGRPLQAALVDVQSQLQRLLPGVAEALSTVGTLTTFLADIALALIATFFISRDSRELGAFLGSLVPAEWRPGLRSVKSDVWRSLLGYVRAVALLVTLTAVITSLGLAMIGSDYALLLGVLTGLADLVPLAGTAVVFAPWILFQLAVGHTGYAVRLLMVYVVQLGVRQALEPKVVGDQVGLHPLAALFTAYVGYKVFGGAGFIWGPILAILLKAMYKSGLLPALSGQD